MTQRVSGARVTAPETPAAARVLTPEALAFLVDLQQRFNPERERRLAARAARQARLDAGDAPDFLPETRSVREGDWSVATVTTADLQRRWVEITGPTDAKMVINALNCGADCFMADFEDANTPTWQNLVEGQANLIDAVDGTLSFSQADGRTYQLNDGPRATLLVRPRGWHLEEKHVEVDGQPMSGSLFDFGVYLFHNAQRLLASQSAPYFYLPKMESHLEARLWNDAFTFSENALGVPHGSIKATVLIETILAAFEMDEILYELRDHSARAKRRSVGLHVQRDQKVPQSRWSVSATRPDPDHDDRAVHAGVYGIVGPDVPQTWRIRHGRHVRVYPEPPRRGGHRDGADQRARG